MKSKCSPPGRVDPTKTALPPGVRIVPKPSRYLKTRYWVVLPETAERKERWHLVPNRIEASKLVSRWMARVSKHALNAKSIVEEQSL